MHGIGEIIKINRKSMKYSQAELCYGICSIPNLSKIENGKRIPTRATFEALMQKMGLSTGVYPSFLTDKDKRAFELKYDFTELYTKGDHESAQSVLAELEETPRLDTVYEMFVLMAKMLLKQAKGHDPTELIREYGKIIPRFIKNFTPSNLGKTPLTKIELNILAAYAGANYEAGNTDLAITLLYEIVSYIANRVYDREGVATLYTKLLATLARYVGMTGDNKETVRLCDVGIAYCIRYFNYRYFPHLLYYKGCSLLILGEKKEAHDCIRQYYYLSCAHGEMYAKEAEIAIAFAEEHGISLP